MSKIAANDLSKFPLREHIKAQIVSDLKKTTDRIDESIIEVTPAMLNAVDGISVTADDLVTERHNAYARIFAAMLLSSDHSIVNSVDQIRFEGCPIAQLSEI